MTTRMTGWRIFAAGGAAAALLGAGLGLAGAPMTPSSAPTAPGDAAARGNLQVHSVRSGSTQPMLSFDGIVEALRHTVVAAQVSGAVVQLEVKPGDRVTAGQLLLRIDPRAADQGAAASEAQQRAAAAARELATKDFERQQQLHAERFISAAALDRARAEYQASTAQAAALAAQAGAARTQSALHVVRAPYAGVVADVPVALGDMALPGRALLTLFDPTALRVSAALPQSLAARAGTGGGVRVELPGLPEATRMQTPRRVLALPAADAGTHTVTVRADLDPGVAGLLPGQFARLWVPSDTASAAAWVPAQALVRRAELDAIYVIDAQGRPLLRQVRLGRRQGSDVEVLSGLIPGERVALDAVAAARVR
jgi:membrane fusion protein, multidrug efflux system